MLGTQNTLNNNFYRLPITDYRLPIAEALATAKYIYLIPTNRFHRFIISPQLRKHPIFPQKRQIIIIACSVDHHILWLFIIYTLFSRKNIFRYLFVHCFFHSDSAALFFCIAGIIQQFGHGGKKSIDV